MSAIARPPDPRSKLTARPASLAEKADRREEGAFPSPAVHRRAGSRSSSAIPSLPGRRERDGKSSLLEAIARNAGFNARGGSRDNDYGGESDESGLAAALALSWLPR